MPQFDAGEIEVYSPDLFPYDAPAAAGECRFAPNCGGVPYGDGKMTRPSFPTCPNGAPAFAEKMGMNEQGSPSRAGEPAEKRYIALCRPMAERRYGSTALRETEAAAGE